jgi:predicted glycosyltransferase
MKVWIDLHNSPHPLLFAPIIRRLDAIGHEVLLTARDNAQTAELARLRWPGIRIVGGPSPTGRVGKAVVVARRIDALRRWAAVARPDVALSHNSYAQIAAARMLTIPSVTAMDYEHQPANHLAFRLADQILIPAALPPSRVRWQGATSGKTSSYPGLKEEIYLGDFHYDPSVASLIGVDRARTPTLVVTRPPPSGASYHHFANPLYSETLKVLARQPSVCCVVLSRTAAQREALTSLAMANFLFPQRALDARSLMYSADLVVGGGGTMTREAALLGVPTYTVFAGRPSAVDDTLVDQGRLRRLRRPEDLARLEPRPQGPVTLADLRTRSQALVEAFVDAALEAPGRRRRRDRPGTGG